ncbi:hypothetical protein [Citrobacter arsenatis]
MKHSKVKGWVNATVDDHEWYLHALLTEYDDVSALLVKNVKTGVMFR